MNKLTLAAVGALCALTVPAQAVIINLGVFAQPPGGSSPTDQMNYLNNTVLPAYNAANNPDLANAIAAGGNLDVQVAGGPSSLSVNLSGFEYLKIKWGNFWQYYYTAGETGSSTFQQPLAPGGGTTGGASHYDQWHSADLPGTGPGPGVGVPDGGTTVALLGAAFAGLALLRRRIA